MFSSQKECSEFSLSRGDEGKPFCGRDESVCVCEGWGEWKRWMWSKDIILIDFWSDTEALLIQLRHILQKNTEHTTDKILLFTLFNTSQHKESPAEVKHTIVSNIARSMYTMLSLLNIVRIIDNPSTTLGHHSRRYEDL